jgi:hypothetical protein
LDVVFRANKIGQGGNLLKNHEEGVPYVVVEGGFEAFRKPAGEKVVAIGVANSGTKWAFGWFGAVEEGKAQFAAEKQAIDIGREAVVLKTSGK